MWLKFSFFLAFLAVSGQKVDYDIEEINLVCKYEHTKATGWVTKRDGILNKIENLIKPSQSLPDLHVSCRKSNHSRAIRESKKSTNRRTRQKHRSAMSWLFTPTTRSFATFPKDLASTFPACIRSPSPRPIWGCSSFVTFGTCESSANCSCLRIKLNASHRACSAMSTALRS